MPMEFFDQLTIPKVEMLTSDWRPTYTHKLYTAISPIVQHTSYGQQLLKALNEDVRVQAMAGTLLSLGHTFVAVQAHSLAAWFLWCASYRGEAEARRILDEWLNAERHEVINTLWVVGLEIDASFSLGNGIALTSITDLPDSDDKENYLTVSRDRLGPVFTRQPACAITQRVKLKKLCRNNEFQAEGKKFSKNSSALYDTAALLNALPGIVCVPYSQTCYVPDLLPPGCFGGRGSNSPIHDVATGRWGKFEAQYIERLNALSEAFSNKREPEKERLR